MRNHGGEATQRKRRIIIDCAVDGTRHDIDLPLDAHPSEGPEPLDVNLAYLRSITRDLVTIAERFAPEDGANHVIDILGIHYKSAKANQRITWHVTYMDARRVPRSIVTDADTSDGAFFNVFWHHASIQCPLRSSSIEEFCAAVDELAPILAQPLPDFASEVARGLTDMVGLVMQVAGSTSEIRSQTPMVPRVEPIRDAQGSAPPLRIAGGRS